MYLAPLGVEINPWFYQGKEKERSYNKRARRSQAQKNYMKKKNLLYNSNGLATALQKIQEVFQMNGNNEIKSSAHSKYRCQYHIVFAPKYRRKEIYGKIKKDIGEVLRKLCNQKGVEIIEAEA